MFDLFHEVGMLPFWLGAGLVLLCLAAAWFRKSRRAAGAAVTLVWVAGFFYVPYFLFQYAAYNQKLEASRIGELLDPADRAHFAETQRAALMYAVLLSVTGATFVVLKSYKAPQLRTSRLEMELAKALQLKHKKAVEKAAEEAAKKSAVKSNASPNEDHGERDNELDDGTTK
ncbi:MAG: hypothetical protein C0483_02200 [Pirellula sp.]|nr:hypothetical protein [Pirellula sp.]